MPDYLFRVWSDQSNGTNSSSHFAPSSASFTTKTTDGSDGMTYIGNRGEELETALLGKHAPANPFIFFTPTLLFALQLAAYKKANGDTNIHISCIAVDTAITSDGRIVTFRPAGVMLKEHGVELRNRSDDSVRDYEGVYIATTSVCGSKGSSYVRYETLLAEGLFQLYPELEEVTKRRNVRLHLTVTDLRKYWFAYDRPLIDEKIGAAARLASAFTPIVEAEETDKLPQHLFTWFLALQKRSTNDPALSQCINRRSGRVPAIIDLTEYETVELPNMPEVDQYEALKTMFGGREVHRSYLSASTGITSPTITKEAAEWHKWHKQSRDEHRAARAERSGEDWVQKRGKGRDRYRENR